MSINRRELIFLSGLGLLWQTFGLKPDSKLAKESQKLLINILEQMEQESCSSAREFNVLASNLLTLGYAPRGSAPQSEMVPPSSKPSKSPRKQLQSLKSRLASSLGRDQTAKQDSPSRRNTISGASPPATQQNLRSPSWASLPLGQAEIHAAAFHATRHSSLDLPSDFQPGSSALGYDYNGPVSRSPQSDAASGAITMADWEHVLSDMDSGYSNIFNGIYGGHECADDPGPFASLTAEHQKSNDGTLSVPPSAEYHDLSPEAWSSSSGDLSVPTHGHTAQSVMSYSGESISSADDNLHPFGDATILPEDMGSILDPFQGLPISTEEGLDEYSLVNGWGRRLAV